MDHGAKFDRLAGPVLILSALGVTLMMAHHPTRLSGHEELNAIVHGVMIALIGTTTYGVTHMALRRGIGRPAPLAGLIAWVIAAFADIGAATINGFAVPALAAHGNVDAGVLALAWALNQSLAQLAVVATGVAFLLWAHGWALRGTIWTRLLGVHGMVFGALPVVLLATGTRMSVAGAMLVYSMQALWIAMLGLYLWSGRFASDLE